MYHDSTLQKVEAVMLRPAKKSTFKFVLHSSKYKSQLEELNKDLDRAVEKFHVSYILSVSYAINSYCTALRFKVPYAPIYSSAT